MLVWDHSDIALLLDHHSWACYYSRFLRMQHFALSMVRDLTIHHLYFVLSTLRVRALKVKRLSYWMVRDAALVHSQCPESLCVLLDFCFVQFISDQWQIVWSGVLDTKLRDVALTINHLRIIIISLSLDLLGLHFLKDIVLCLMHAHHVGIDGRTLMIVLVCIVWSLVSFELVLLPWCYHGLLGVGRADVVLLVSLCACDSVQWLLLHVTDLDHLLSLWNVCSLHRVYKWLLACLVKWYLNSSIVTPYKNRMVKL